MSITGVPGFRLPFEPLVPGGARVPNTNFYAPEEVASDEKQFGLWAANRVEEAILHEGPDSVAAVFVEPVQNVVAAFQPRVDTSSGCARFVTLTSCCWSPMR
jgi:adenosylmethionine-8-amino-7-oxononanoate aminotransferase